MSKKSHLQLSYTEDDNSKKIKDLKNNAFLTWADRTPTYRIKGREQSPKCNVIRILSFPEKSPQGNVEWIKEFGFSHNLVTDDGEIYYAKKGAGEAPSANENFLCGRFELGTTGYTEAETDDFSDFDVSCTSKIACSRVTFTACYPRTNDTGDADNTGDAIDAVSYAINYTTGQANDATIEQGVIHDNACPGACTSLLAAFSFCVFAKTSCDTLKIFVNHAFENQP